jgi:bifunctional non-homologous end joining protein LigD
LKIGKREIEISNRDKVFFPDCGVTKGQIVDYYEAVADFMVAHTKRHGVALHRFPDGIGADSFYQKDVPGYFPDWIGRVPFPKREGGSFTAPMVDGKAALVYLANQGVLTFHMYLSRAEDLEHPDRMIYDLDPPEDTRDFDAVRAAALDLRDVLDELELKSWIQTTGSKGFHIVVPLDRHAGFDEVRAFAGDVARVLARRKPDAYTHKQRKEKRKGRIFLDTLRNAYGATAVAPYSVRGRAGAPVATPIEWGELERGASPRDWTVGNILDRLAQKPDPWSHMMRHAYRISNRRRRLDHLLEMQQPVEED